MDIFTAIIIIIGVSFVADFPLQGEFLGKYKSKSVYLLSVHCVIYSLLTAGAFVYVFEGTQFGRIFCGLFFSHFFIDKAKCDLLDKKAPLKEKKILLYIDQALHLLVILIIIGSVYW